jgi:hypothetical protein
MLLNLQLWVYVIHLGYASSQICEKGIVDMGSIRNDAQIKESSLATKATGCQENHSNIGLISLLSFLWFTLKRRIKAIS